MSQRSRVLIVEDHVEMRKLIAGLIANEYEVAGEVDDGDAVLAAARAKTPDVVLLDISLPGRSGMQLLPELRRALPATAIIIVSNKAEPAYRDESFRRGADSFVDKSRISTELLPAIAGALQARRDDTVQQAAREAGSSTGAITV